MKAHVIEHAMSMGAQRILASNKATNPMLQINLKFGYTPIDDKHEYKKEMI